jgi:DNA-binding NarL/FixJ family response regulator
MMQPKPFTKRQEQVLAGLCEGRTNKEIGNPLGLTEKTIKAHVTEILRKLDCTNRTQAVLKTLGKV